MASHTPRKDYRLVLAIALKDIGETLRNKNVLALVITTVLVTVLYRYLPLIRASQELPYVAIYDAGDSQLVPLLENSAVVEARAYTSEERMLDRIRSGDLAELGITVPEGFDDDLNNGRSAALTAYALHWVADEDLTDLVQIAEGEIAIQLGVFVPIQVSDLRVFPSPDSGGMAVTLAMSLVYTVLMIGMMTTPQMMLEEKQTRTLDALLVSPASEIHVTLGKALAGLFYALLGGAVGWAFFAHVVVHWWLAAAATLVWALFAVALGLVLGTLLEVRQQLSLWGWVVIIPILLPMMLYLLEDVMPDIVGRIAGWVPSSVVLDLVRAAAARPLTTADWAIPLVAAGAYATVAITVQIIVMRRRAR